MLHISRRLGHSSGWFTSKRYEHLLARTLTAAPDATDRALGDPVPTTPLVGSSAGLIRRPGRRHPGRAPATATEASNGRFEHLRDSAQASGTSGTRIARSLLETSGFKPRRHRRPRRATNPGSDLAKPP